MTIARESLQAERDMVRLLAGELPRDIFLELAGGLYQEGRGFLRTFRGTMPGKFKSGGARVANAFKVYTAGNNLEALELGVFTKWAAGELYERGGTISPKKEWLVVPLSRDLVTAAGRVKRGVRDRSGKFRRELFEGLKPIKLRKGWLLVREVKGDTRGRIRRRGFRAGSANAMEAVFMLIPYTRRRGVLDFFGSFERNGINMNRMGDRIGRALDRAARRLRTTSI